MSSFDYITVKEFREALEADYAEMRRCADVEAWKSVQVLAGSIVETLLVDYLSATTHATRTSKDLLKLDLAEAITICRGEKVLSERTADLCSVVRSFRNLIHPGRMVRLNEQAPNKESATIALALIDMITEELAKVLRAAVGLTAEQIVSKIKRDADALTILKHILAEVSEQQRERLLTELIPAAYDELREPDDPLEPFDDMRPRLAAAYRVILETMSIEVRQRVAAEFVRVLRDDDGERVLTYGGAFFKPSDLQFVPEQNKAMVREHLLGRVSSTHNFASLKQIEGIARHLAPSDVMKWLDPFVRTVVSSTLKESLKNKAWQQLVFESAIDVPTKVEEKIAKRLDTWISHFEKEKATDKAELVRKLKNDVTPIPF